MLEELSKMSTKIYSGEFNCFDLVRCVFNLNETDIQILQSFDNNNGKTIKQIIQKISKDRSTVHRSLEKLISCNICYKERKSGNARGFVDYYYRISDKDIFKKAEVNLDKCYSSIKKMLVELE